MSDGKVTLSRKTILVAGALATALVIAGAAGGYWFAQRANTNVDDAETGEQQVLYWYDPMVPDQHFDKPGKSPFMDMDLVPRYAGDAAGDAVVSINPGVSQNLGIRLATVDRRAAQAHVRVSGTLSFNERDVAVVQARADGFVASARPLAVGDVVRAGDALVTLRAPRWTSALAEYLSLRAMSDQALARASRQRLAMLGLPQAEIDQAEATGVAPAVFTIRAPISGAVTALGVKGGMTISEGAPLATINGLSPVWLTASVPQAAAGRLKPGAPALATLPAFPGETFTGKIENVLPQANTASRTVEVRVALPNPGGRFRPGMTAEVDLSDGAARDVLTTPAEAVIRTGRRSVVIVAGEQSGEFIPTEVELGSVYGDRIEIVQGLTEGQRVVVSGQFLIDSEASLTGVLARLQKAGGSAGASPTDATYASTGQVTAVDDTGVTLTHPPVPELNWPSMTMKFGWGPEGSRPEIKPGAAVSFRFREGGAGYELEWIAPAGARP